MRLRILATCLVGFLIAGCSAAPRPSPDDSNPGPPTAMIEAPASGATVSVGQTLRITARGEDRWGVSRLDLLVDNLLVDSASTPNAAAQRSFAATLEWTPTAEGEVTISALAYRPTGTGSRPATMNVTVLPGSSAVSASPAVGAISTPSSAPTTTPTDEPQTAIAAPTRAPRPTPPPAPRRQQRSAADTTPQPAQNSQPRSTPAPTTKPTEASQPRSTPDPTPRRTSTPKPSPTPTPEPTTTPPPTAEPALADLRIRPRDIPDPWYAQTDVELKVAVRNVGTSPSPRFAIRGQIGDSDLARITVDAGGLEPGTGKVFTLVLRAPRAGDARNLRVEVRLLDGAVDSDPSNNVFVTQVNVGERPANTPKPSPTPTPEPTTTPPPTAEPATADLRIRPRDIPDPWYAQTDVELKVAVRNVGSTSSPRFAIRGRIGGGDLARITVDAGGLEPGTGKVFTLVLRAPRAGDARNLRVEVRLLDGAVDSDPSNNVFVTQVNVRERPADDPSPSP
jgi:hypothetical protein